MNVPDVNVLVALYRPDHAHHHAATTWWRQSAGLGETFTVPDLGWVGFVRVTTNPRIFEEPATFDEAWRFVETISSVPTHLRMSSAGGVLDQFTRLGQQVGASGNLVTDAYIAGTAAALAGTVVTFDRDFRKFDGLRITELAV